MLTQGGGGPKILRMCLRNVPLEKLKNFHLTAQTAQTAHFWKFGYLTISMVCISGFLLSFFSFWYVSSDIMNPMDRSNLYYVTNELMFYHQGNIENVILNCPRIQYNIGVHSFLDFPIGFLAFKLLKVQLSTPDQNCILQKISIHILIFRALCLFPKSLNPFISSKTM